MKVTTSPQEIFALWLLCSAFSSSIPHVVAYYESTNVYHLNQVIYLLTDSQSCAVDKICLSTMMKLLFFLMLRLFEENNA